MNPELVFEVCSRDEAGAILTSPDRRADVAFLVSISDPDHEPPLGYDSIDDKARLLFIDSDDHRGPSEEHVRELIALAERLRGKRGRVVVHCLGGVSRSSAAAIILRNVLDGAGHEDEIVADVVARRPIAQPNQRMIAFADRLLGRNGKLIASVRNGVRF